MSIKLCEKCKGSKKHASLGFIEHSCHVCDGVGFVEYSMPLLHDIDKDKEQIVKPQKKPKKKKPKAIIHADSPLAKLQQRVKQNVIVNT